MTYNVFGGTLSLTQSITVVDNTPAMLCDVVIVMVASVHVSVCMCPHKHCNTTDKKLG